MKTTIDLPDELFRRAKATVAMRGLTLKEFFARAAEGEIRRLEAEQSGVRATPSWHRLLRHPSAEEREELDRIDEVIEEELSQIDVDSWK